MAAPPRSRPGCAACRSKTRRAQQLQNIATLPFVGPWVAVMPDVHLGIGATVGSVMPDARRDHPGRGRRRHRLRHGRGAHHPARRATCPTTSRSFAVRSSAACRSATARAASTAASPTASTRSWRSRAWWHGSTRSRARHPKIRSDKLDRQIGTLGGGNHFIELCLDEADARVGDAALRLARHRQPHRQLLHRAGAPATGATRARFPRAGPRPRVLP